jgi:hypothetical protein
MIEPLSQLLAQAHRPLSAADAILPPLIMAQAADLVGELTEMLAAKNDFFVFGPALHVFPCDSNDLSWELVQWNMPGLSKHEYTSFVDPGLCFAEDIFGNQFCIRDGGVYLFTVETGELKYIASSLNAWAGVILNNDRFWTGWPVAQRWVDVHGGFPLHKRLLPAIPFICNGSFELDNLQPVDASELMCFWGNFATQVRHLPDGTQLRYRFTER